MGILTPVILVNYFEENAEGLYSMYFKLLACETFTREICACMDGLPHAVDLEFTAIDSHDQPEKLRKSLQEKIDAADASGRSYDAILLCYGLCGNATAGLVARATRLVIPRAHDCCTILLGSRKLFRQHFEECPSQSFSSRGHMERSTDGHVHHAWMLAPDGRRALLARIYGEENADLLAQVMAGPDTGRQVYVNVGPTHSSECILAFREKAAAEKKDAVVLEGSLSLVHNLMLGNWYPEDFLVVYPGRTISGVYDWDRILEVKEV
jgi:hypothetical protein